MLRLRTLNHTEYQSFTLFNMNHKEMLPEEHRAEIQKEINSRIIRKDYREEFKKTDAEKALLKELKKKQKN